MQCGMCGRTVRVSKTAHVMEFEHHSRHSAHVHVLLDMLIKWERVHSTCVSCVSFVCVVLYMSRVRDPITMHSKLCEARPYHTSTVCLVGGQTFGCARVSFQVSVADINHTSAVRCAERSHQQETNDSSSPHHPSIPRRKFIDTAIATKPGPQSYLLESIWKRSLFASA